MAESDTRTIWNILWSSLTVTFACTWVACHPNVPGLEETWSERKLRRIKVFAIAVLAPEIIAGWAIRQFFAARKIGKGFPIST
jgi:ABC-type spermidine/putrescine transport system permease subunit II